MISSANIDVVGALVQIALMIFFGIGIFTSLLLFIYHAVKKIEKSGFYYLVRFIVSGLIAVLFAAFLFLYY